jgi:adenylate kinase
MKPSKKPRAKGPIAIVVLGRPGSGKGTQAALLAKKLGLFHFETSDVIQEKFRKFPNDPEIKRAKEFFYGGKMTPTRLVTKWVIEKIKKLETKRIIFDGSPRTLYEVKRIYPILVDKCGRVNIKILNIKISPQEAIWRNTRRKTCQKCDSPIPYTKQTKDLKICPRKGCGGKLITREDDKPEKIKKRLKVFMKETYPVIKFFKKKGLLIEINGEQSIEDVFKDILKVIR